MAVIAPTISADDSALQLKVKVEFRINPKTESFARTIGITVRRSTVTLEGQVPSEIDARNAERVAMTVVGVSSVVNKLTVAKS